MKDGFETLDCRGLSAPLTMLRIRQNLCCQGEAATPLHAVVDSDCDCDSLSSWLAGVDEDVHLMKGATNTETSRTANA
ncbi:hypothetical protein [Pelagovum pacificum]|uniref:Uncharacterized protein n=1 Tax=Pelagovum pacificum TaxID=2588711 RepID=A0A5C5GEU0_9RHOB|nr:hypothetical protein [Pelagovum pacificum]QQA43583.1 hypothetical protein I8N54_03120 [Pelagovum pacificum]TNY33282.1 hypothetical protein FHY64_08410 [Pelagovum pacificum]